MTDQSRIFISQSDKRVEIYKNWLRNYFNPPDTDKSPAMNRIGTIIMRKEVYQSYMWLRLCAWDMVNKTEEVLADEAHQEILIRGPGLGYRMPEVEPVQEVTKALRTALENLKPDDASFTGSKVRLSAKTARHFMEVAILSDRMTYLIEKAVRESEYMLWIRALRVTGEPYRGPSNLQSVLNTWDAFLSIHLAQVIYPTSRRGQKLQADWVQRLG